MLDPPRQDARHARKKQKLRHARKKQKLQQDGRRRAITTKVKPHAGQGVTHKLENDNTTKEVLPLLGGF